MFKMNNEPEVKIKYTEGMDERINSDLTEVFFEKMQIGFDRETMSFFTPLKDVAIWLRDGHAHEWEDWESAPEDKKDKELHYYYMRGMGDWQKNTPISFQWYYDDQQSVPKEENPEGFVQAPGKWVITLWFPAEFQDQAEKIAKDINDVYAGTMKRVLHAYFIPSWGPYPFSHEA